MYTTYRGLPPRLPTPKCTVRRETETTSNNYCSYLRIATLTVLVDQTILLRTAKQQTNIPPRRLHERTRNRQRFTAKCTVVLSDIDSATIPPPPSAPSFELAPVASDRHVYSVPNSPFAQNRQTKCRPESTLAVTFRLLRLGTPYFMGAQTGDRYTRCTGSRRLLVWKDLFCLSPSQHSMFGGLSRNTTRKRRHKIRNAPQI